MKVAVQCESPLLQQSLELFLKGHLSSLKQCELVIRDYKSDDETHPSLYISSDEDADIVKPFSRSQVMLAVENRLKKDEDVQQINTIADAMEEVPMHEETLHKSSGDQHDFAILERRIEKLTQEYQHNIIQAIRAFYEK